ncbi:MAG: hypothetical protein ACI92Z_000391 [Paracoccaceae bacterium]
MIGVGAFSAGGTGGDGISTSSAAEGGAGGLVTATLTDQSTISTDGVQAHALYAQSQGGQGGYLHPKNGAVNFSNEAAGRGGAAGNVVINHGLDDIGSTSVGSIDTGDDHAHGILAQSLGGGGGSGYQSFVLFANNVGGGGAAGTVTVTGTSEISTSDNYAIGIVAQSISGGGGNAGQVPSSVDVPDASGNTIGSRFDRHWWQRRVLGCG